MIDRACERNRMRRADPRSRRRVARRPLGVQRGGGGTGDAPCVDPDRHRDRARGRLHHRRSRRGPAAPTPSAPTPSAAAESVVPDAGEWAARYRALEARLIAAARRGLAARGNGVRMLAKRLVHPRRRLFDHSQRLDAMTLRLSRAANGALRERRARFSILAARLARHAPDRVARAHRARCEALERRLQLATHAVLAGHRARVSVLERALGAFGPQATLERGYSILLRADGRSVVRDAREVRTGERLRARLARGMLDLDVADAGTGGVNAGFRVRRVADKGPDSHGPHRLSGAQGSRSLLDGRPAPRRWQVTAAAAVANSRVSRSTEPLSSDTTSAGGPSSAILVSSAA